MAAVNLKKSSMELKKLGCVYKRNLACEIPAQICDGDIVDDLYGENNFLFMI